MAWKVLAVGNGPELNDSYLSRFTFDPGEKGRLELRFYYGGEFITNVLNALSGLTNISATSFPINRSDLHTPSLISTVPPGATQVATGIMIEFEQLKDKTTNYNTTDSQGNLVIFPLVGAVLLFIWANISTLISLALFALVGFVIYKFVTETLPAIGDAATKAAQDFGKKIGDNIFFILPLALIGLYVLSSSSSRSNAGGSPVIYVER